jgi:hypothetical protein
MSLRTEAFLDAFFELLANVEPVNQNAGTQLVAIAKTIDDVDYISLCNLATFKEVMHGALFHAIEVKLTCIGADPELDYADASAFFGAPIGDRRGAEMDATLSRATTPFLLSGWH